MGAGKCGRRENASGHRGYDPRGEPQFRRDLPTCNDAEHVNGCCWGNRSPIKTLYRHLLRTSISAAALTC